MNLKRCPFCGAVVIKVNKKLSDINRLWIFCPTCFKYMHGDLKGIKLWNTRPIEDELRQYLNRIIAAYQKISFQTRLLIPDLTDILDEYEKKDKSNAHLKLHDKD